MDVSGFSVHAPRPDVATLLFEDISIMGFVHVAASAETIVLDWQSIQDSFLKQNASRFMQDPTKAWNVYSVLLTSEPASSESAAALFSIEEDFRGTRKVARAGVVSREDVIGALAPIIPLRNVLSMGLVDARQRLLDRLGSIAPALRGIAEDTPAEAIAASLLGTE